MKAAAKQEAVSPQPAASSTKVAKPANPTTRVKLSYSETRELDALPVKIETLEREQADITARLGDTAIYRDSPDQAKALQLRFAAIEAELMACLARWDELEAKRSAE